MVGSYFLMKMCRPCFTLRAEDLPCHLLSGLLVGRLLIGARQCAIPRCISIYSSHHDALCAPPGASSPNATRDVQAFKNSAVATAHVRGESYNYITIFTQIRSCVARSSAPSSRSQASGAPLSLPCMSSGENLMPSWQVVNASLWRARGTDGEERWCA